MERKLYRSQRDRVLLGVCGGLGEYFGIDATIIRVIAVLLTVFTWIVPGLVAYFIIAIIAPNQGSSTGNPQDAFRENIEDIKDSATKFGENIRHTLGTQDKGQGKNQSSNSLTVVPPEAPPRSPNRGVYLLGIIIIAIGAFLLLVNFLDWFWTKLWPIWLIAAGAVIIFVVAIRKK